MKTTAKLRQLLHTGPMVVPLYPECHACQDRGSRRFPAVYMTGAGTASERGFPEVGC